MNNGLSNLYSLFKHRSSLSYGQAIPAQTNFEFTYRCNLSCKTCGVKSKRDSNGKEELSTLEIMNALLQLKEIGCNGIGFVGGEPLMRGDVFDLLEFIRFHGLSGFVYTNGVLLTDEKRRQLLKSGVSQIAISVDGIDEVHNLIRGKDIFATVRDNINALTELRRRSRLTDTRISIHCTVSDINAGSLASLIPFCEELGVDSLSYQYLTEFSAVQLNSSILGRGAIGSDRFVPSNGSLKVSGERYRDFLEELHKVVSYRGPLKVSHHNISSLSRGQILGGVFPVQRCFWLNYNLIVDPYGYIYPCANIDRYFYGNIRQNAIRDIWFGEKAQFLRQRIKQGLLPVCQSCCHFGANMTLAQMFTWKLRQTIGSGKMN